MHCMLETFLCHVFLLAQVQDRMPPKSVAFIPELPEQYRCYRKAHQVTKWHLYIIPSLAIGEHVTNLCPGTLLARTGEQIKG